MKYRYPQLNAEMPGKEEVLALTPNPATRDLLEHMDNLKIENIWDRFEKQQPQCGYGLRNLCCRMCQWGPCRITAKAPRGICGRDENAIVMANILRALVAGLAAHWRHAHEVILSIIAAAEGRANLPIKGETRVWELMDKLGLNCSRDNLKEAALKVASVLMEDLGRLTWQPLRLLEAYAPEDRKEVWRRLGVLPRSGAYEVLEALHMTTLGGCTDWKEMAAQELRSALAYCYATLFTSSLATEILFGIPEPKLARVNYGVLKADHINILLHGHSPVMVEKVLEKLNTPEIKELVHKVGAKGIVVGGMCCTGDELLARYGIPTVTNIMGQELALGTGAVDAVIVDMQCVIPGLKIVADCFGTQIITTCPSNRIPGAVHIPFDPERPETLDEDALQVARLAIETYARRDRNKIFIPSSTTQALVGWSLEAILERFGGGEKIARFLKEGTIKGLATVVGCNTPKVPYEHSHVTITRKLIEGDILVTTTGCCSHALLNAGLCDPEAADLAGPGLKRICRELGIPPVLAVGGCVDNTRTLRLFFTVAQAAGAPLAQMPLAFVGPEPGNEKTVGQGVSFLAHGISNFIGFPGPLPVPIPSLRQEATSIDDLDRGSTEVTDFFAGEGLKELLGAKIFTEPYPELAAQAIKMHIKRQRWSLGWR